MAKKNYYAVKNGHNPGIYKTWNECSKQVSGFSGAVFKGFTSLLDAENFIKSKDKNTKKNTKKDSSNKYKTRDKEAIELSKKNQALSIYTDGGWGNKEDGGKMYCGGFLIVKDGKIISRHCVSGDDAGLAELRNVAGEMQAVVKAIDYVSNNHPNIKKLYIFADYVGLIHWSIPKELGGWRRKNIYTKKYGNYLEKIGKEIDIELTHVKGHNKDPFNEEADCLASYSKELYFRGEKYNNTEFLNNYSYIGK